MVLVPVLAKALFDFEVLVIYLVRRAGDLDVTTGLEGDFLVRRQLEHQLLDEGGHILIGAHFTLPAAHAEDLRGHPDLHVLLDLDLTRKTAPFASLAARDVAGFGGQHGATALEHVDFADAATAFAATGGGNKDLLVGQDAQ